LTNKTPFSLLELCQLERINHLLVGECHTHTGQHPGPSAQELENELWALQPSRITCIDFKRVKPLIGEFWVDFDFVTMNSIH